MAQDHRGPAEGSRRERCRLRNAMMKMLDNIRHIRLREIALTTGIMLLPLVPITGPSSYDGLVTQARAADMPKLNTSRLVSIGGDVTEIVYALGEEKRLIARDSTSTYPDAATKLPDVGYMRALSPEG